LKFSLKKTALNKILRKIFPDAQLVVKSKCVSTQAEIKKIIRKNPAKGILFIAGEQKGGYGRFGRKFFSPPGGLWFSLFIPQRKNEFSADLAIKVASYIKKRLNKKFHLHLKTKKPNDIISSDGRKLAGILVTKIFKGLIPQGAIIGVGLNVNNDTDFDAVDAVSLAELLGKTVPLEEALEVCLQSIADIV